MPRFYISTFGDEPIFIDNKDNRYEQQESYLVHKDTFQTKKIVEESDDFIELLDIYIEMKFEKKLKTIKEELKYGRH